MIKGYLKIMVLRELNISEHTGYGLIKNLSGSLGRKPSPGSMYPLLNDLLESGLIKVRDEGRMKIYSITGKGREKINKLLKEKEAIMVMHAELVRLCSDKKCEVDFGPVSEILENLNQKGDVLLRNIDVWSELRYAVFRLLLSEDVESREDEARRILKETTRQLERLSGG
jgi:DNA-binding PadR family transcriptional regulator